MPTQTVETLLERLRLALNARSSLLDDDHQAALRLFSGFYEGFPELVVDLYADTLVLFGYGDDLEVMGTVFDAAQRFLLERFPWVNCVVRKRRQARNDERRRGVIAYGEEPAQQIREHGVWYAIDLLMNQDASFYLDTWSLRRWLLDHMAGMKVLNTFAYTGSLGVAALAGGAARVVQVDRSRRFLSLARESGMRSRLDIGRMKLKTADFFPQVAQFKRQGELFDCVIVDPPFFSTTQKGTIDLIRESVRTINKVRPLIKDGGNLVAINNALFLSGADYIEALEGLCKDGYLQIDQLIPVPDDLCGYPDTIVTPPPCDPTPFNHPTKIVVLGVRRKT
jgi:23S rRNA (cytosine1962-C5)-methyltransferase